MGRQYVSIPYECPENWAIVCGDGSKQSTREIIEGIWRGIKKASAWRRDITAGALIWLGSGALGAWVFCSL